MSYRSPHAHEFDLRKNSHYQEHGWPELERRHAARITMLDEQVQRLLDKLEAMGELDNTLILFTSDNGPHGEKGRDPEQFASSGGLRGFKRDMYKGGQKTVSPAEFTDVFPTLCELTGVPVPDQLQGVSLVPVMKDPAVKVRKGATTLYKSTGIKGAKGYSYRTERYRYIEWIDESSRNVVGRDLFDYEKDPFETRSLAGNPEYAKIMKGLAEDLYADAKGWKLLEESLKTR